MSMNKIPPPPPPPISKNFSGAKFFRANDVISIDRIMKAFFVERKNICRAGKAGLGDWTNLRRTRCFAPSSFIALPRVPCVSAEPPVLCADYINRLYIALCSLCIKLTCCDLICVEKLERQMGGKTPWGASLYEQHGYVAPHWAWLFSCFGQKQGIEFGHFGLWVMAFVLSS